LTLFLPLLSLPLFAMDNFLGWRFWLGVH